MSELPVSELRPHYSSPDARDLILDAALKIFSVSGFEGASIRQVALAAKVSPPLIHHHFKDKETLWEQVGERVTADFQAWFKDLSLTDCVVDKETIPTLVGAYMAYWKSHPSALRFQLWRVMGTQDQERKRRSEQLNSLFVPIFARAREAGHIRDDIPPGQAMITVGGLIQYWLHSQIEAQDAIAVGGHSVPDDQAFLAYVLSLIIRPA
ncbi:TetR/AcrR family transcriptional regulator [Pseudomonas gingeri NCPPB 3146 = LMG 5327]|uniref:TetR/AcrR family transcriptional regulator n=2 Tax=Pseudomonas gingeri TaxID=117681 RepID=A0A7Y7XYA3_9PSED|nr:TetR/AcrR family transcriptional regulator [Pseudomonas gingeri]NWC13613.1 TetR/AcrR family transcriptional regulator [Pseudomonas gingeri]NWE67787.1 TetR/AcrR family transcriptional regulator [Pseudomonas gingeri]PNQ90836.1 TetR/AcrR family transcriptional regulator [Pseudomonas gingeri NCPPB 3146 = LMG 5327]